MTRLRLTFGAVAFLAALWVMYAGTYRNLGLVWTIVLVLLGPIGPIVWTGVVLGMGGWMDVVRFYVLFMISAWAFRLLVGRREPKVKS